MAILLSSNSNEISNWLQSSLAVVNHLQPHHCTYWYLLLAVQASPPTSHNSWLSVMFVHRGTARYLVMM